MAQDARSVYRDNRPGPRCSGFPASMAADRLGLQSRFGCEGLGYFMGH